MRARLLAPRGIGRVAFATASGLAVLPVNYSVTGATVVIRTGSGSLIGGHGDGPVSLEADHFDLELGQGWSVLVQGEAHRVLQPGELQNLREDCDLRPWPAVALRQGTKVPAPGDPPPYRGCPPRRTVGGSVI